MNGHLREHPLVELITEISAANLSGALRLARERVQAVVYAEAGDIVFARSNLRLYRLAPCLQRWGIVAEGKLTALVTEFMNDAETGASLIAAGVLTPGALSKLHSRQATDVLRPMLLWTEGEWNFDARARLAEDVRGNIETRQLLLEGARKLPADFAAARLSGDEEIISPVREMPAQLQLLPLEGFILSRVETPLPLGEVVAGSGLPEAQVRHAVYTLTLAGFLARDVWPSPLSSTQAAGAATVTKAATKVPVNTEQSAPTPPKPDPPPDPRAEIEALFARVYNADYYQILDVKRDAGIAEVKRAYYALAKRFHPDRFQRDADDALRAQIETAFTQLTQAYETLREPRTRAAYDSKISAQFMTPDAPASPGRAGKQASANNSLNSHLAREQRAEDSFRQGLDALKQNDYAAAVSLLGEATRLVPQQPRYHAFYGNVLARDARTQRQAETELQMALRLDADAPSYRVMLADLYRALGQTLRAIRELERALAIDPNQEVARRLLDRLRKTKGSEGNNPK